MLHSTVTERHEGEIETFINHDSLIAQLGQCNEAVPVFAAQNRNRFILPPAWALHVSVTKVG